MRLLLVILTIGAIASPALAYVERSQGEVIAYLELVEPSIPRQGWPELARTIRATALKHDLDPATIVATAWEESSAGKNAGGAGHPDLGFMQLRVSVHPGCKGNPAEAPSCQRARACAHNPHCAIRYWGALVTEARRICHLKTNRPALMHRWLQMLAGLNHPRAAYRGIWCGQRKEETAPGKHRWVDIPWHKGKGRDRFRGIRNIISCRKSLLKGRQCVREKPPPRRRRKRSSARG